MRFAVASIVSAAVVLASPFMGQLQAFLRRSLTTRQYVLLFGVGVLAAVAATIPIALVRIRERRATRFALLAVALVFGACDMWMTGTPWPEVNAVERVHFVEYGLIAFLFYRAWQRAADLSLIVFPMLAAFMVGTLDEWLQWFIPVRVGEAHDVFLNLAAIVCGLLFAFALDPPPAFALRLHRHAAARVGMFAALVWLVFAGFVSQVHLGYTIDLDAVSHFRSHYSSQRLAELQRDRAATWRVSPPLTLRRLSQEDQYLDEGLWHVKRRNSGEPIETWRENLILERFFGPVLDTPTYASPHGNRWPPELRADLEARAAAITADYISAAEPYPIVTWPRTTFWLVVLGVAALLAALPLVMSDSWLRRGVARRH